VATPGVRAVDNATVRLNARCYLKNLPVEFAPATEPSSILVEPGRFIGSGLYTQLANQTVCQVCLAALVLRERRPDLISAFNLKLSGSKHLINGPGDFFTRLVCAREHPGKFTQDTGAHVTRVFLCTA